MNRTRAMVLYEARQTAREQGNAKGRLGSAGDRCDGRSSCRRRKGMMMAMCDRVMATSQPFCSSSVWSLVLMYYSTDSRSIVLRVQWVHSIQGG
jgi:hypothetical protein